MILAVISLLNRLTKLSAMDSLRWSVYLSISHGKLAWKENVSFLPPLLPFLNMPFLSGEIQIDLQEFGVSKKLQPEIVIGVNYWRSDTVTYNTVVGWALKVPLGNVGFKFCQNLEYGTASYAVAIL